MQSILKSKEQPVFITGPAGLIETIITLPEEGVIRPIVGIMCHPHSLHGGTMQNKVVTTVARVFNELGVPAIRFNFRGVGRSEGEYAAGIGETDDLHAVLSWAEQHYPGAIIWLAGFSFGSFVSFRAANISSNVEVLISLAPPVNHYSFMDWPLPLCRWLVIQGEADEIVPAQEVFSWLDQLPRTPDLVTFPEVGHYFHGHLLELRRVLTNWLKESL